MRKSTILMREQFHLEHSFFENTKYRNSKRLGKRELELRKQTESLSSLKKRLRRLRTWWWKSSKENCHLQSGLNSDRNFVWFWNEISHRKSRMNPGLYLPVVQVLHKIISWQWIMFIKLYLYLLIALKISFMMIPYSLI